MQICPNSVSTGLAKPTNKKILDSTLARRLGEPITVDGTTMTVAQALANRLIDIALFAESNKDAVTASKLIFERVNGKAAVMVDDTKEEMPPVTFRLSTEGVKKLEELKNIPAAVESEPSGRIVAEVDGEVMEF